MAFRLFGFPVSIEGSFVLTIGFIGWFSFGEQFDRIAACVAIAVLAGLIHEFGHAFAARSQGTVGTPAISLAGMAGLTRYRLQEKPSRAMSIFISFAGPLTGLVLGAVIFAVRQAGVVDETPFISDLFRIGLFTTIGWSIFNLIPIVPLDGGHIMTDLLPGDRLERRRRAAWVSIGIAVLLAPVAWFTFRSIFALAYLGFFAFQNWKSLQNLPAVPHPTAKPQDQPLQ